MIRKGRKVKGGKRLYCKGKREIERVCVCVCVCEYEMSNKDMQPLVFFSMYTHL